MREIIPLLQTIIKSINELNNEEYQKLLEGKGTLVFRENKEKPIKKATFSIEKYKHQLDLLDDRDKAYNLLKELKKDVLLEFTQTYNIYALKGDKKEVIIEKIIEAFIGVKLRHKAIKELDLSYRR